MNNFVEGYVITTNVASLSRIECDEVWLITRAGPDIEGAIRVRNWHQAVPCIISI